MKILSKKRATWRKVAKLFVYLFIGSLVFFSGWALGNGRLKLERRSPLAISRQLPQDLDYSGVEKVYDTLKKDFDGDIDLNKLQDGLKEGLAKSLGDPYTEYFNKEAAKAFNEDLSGTFSGIGAELGKEDNAVVVIAPLAGYPAEKAGLRPKDVIVAVDGESIFDFSVTEAVKKVRGPKDTKVTLTIIRGGSQELKFEITRAEISIPSVETKTLDGNIGYIKISRFSDDTAKLAAAAATSFKKANVKGVIVDVRGNPGGFLNASVDVASLWLDKDKTILEEKRGGLLVQRFKSKGPSTLSGVKTVVLINEGSASASEILAGALKDNGAATLLGEKSYGKGSVQQPEELGDGSLLKVTVARWYTPSGRNIDKEGIEPDEKVARSEDDFKNKRDPQLDKALEAIGR